MNGKPLNGKISPDASLSRLYRRMTAQGASAAEITADDLVAAASGEADEAIAAKLALSPRHADLARLLRELEPASAELATSVRRQGCAHPHKAREAQRPSHRERPAARRRARWFGGFAAAACLALSLGVVGIWHGKMAAPRHHDVVASSPVPATDRIFTSDDRIFASNERPHHAKPARGGDELFRGDFSGS